MDNNIKEEIGNLVDNILADYKGGKNIDAADINGNGSVDIGDAVQILRMAMGL